MQHRQIQAFRNSRPGFGHHAARYRQRLARDQLHQPPAPAQPKQAHRPGPLARAPPESASDPADRDRRRAAHRQHPQRRDRHGQPPSGGRAGSGRWVCCHGQPPRWPQLKHGSHPPRRASHCAAQSSGGKSVRTPHGSAGRAPHQAPNGRASCQADAANALPAPRQRMPTGPTRSRTQTNWVCPRGRKLRP